MAAQAADILPISSTVRGLGMGNAQFGIVEGADSLRYNPAGLARTKGMTWKIVGLGVGVGSDVVNNIDAAQDLGNSGSFAEALGEFYGDKIFANGSAETSLAFPYLAFAVYNQTYASVTLHNPVYPELPVRFLNDYVYAAGVGFPVLPFLHVGADFKRIKRSGVETTYRVSSLTDLDPEVIKSDFTKWGVGYAMDLGANLVIDAPAAQVILSGVWSNVGDTHFRSENDSEIPVDKSSMGVGLGVLMDFPLISVAPSLDVVDLNRDDIQLMRKINFGVEVGLPLLDLRAGFNQGYYSLGAGVDIGLFRFDAATYGVEMGEYPGQIEDRRYMVEMTLQLGIGSFFSSDGASGSSGESTSIWGGRRKQRR